MTVRGIIRGFSSRDRDDFQQHCKCFWRLNPSIMGGFKDYFGGDMVRSGALRNEIQRDENLQLFM